MKILISAYTGLGNFILKTPMIKTIKELYPECVIDIIAGNSFGTEFILENSDLIHKTWILKENASLLTKIKFFSKLKFEGYDAVFLSFDANKKFIFFGAYFFGVQTIVTHIMLKNRLKSIFYLLLSKVLAVPLLQGRHEIDLNYDLLEAWHNKPFVRNYRTFISSQTNEKVLNRFNVNKHHYFVLQIGAANGTKSAKKWSNKNFINLISELNKLYPDYTVVTVGDNGDYINDIKPLENENIVFVNTAGKTTIDEVASLLYYSKLVIANDSGIMHMANALDCNLIALYGPTDHTRTKPLGQKSHILFSKNECYQKMYNFSGSEVELYKEYPDCMDGITTKDVLNKITGVLDDK